ncbi:MAG: hydroxyethylthiazole kinase [Bacteroidales bacterium]|nr:hydroxyethylthiazole kinase [Bacteroidales bacterium]
MDLQTLHDKVNVVRRHRPLIYNITNHVAMNFSANVLLALGASPIMSNVLDEAEEIARQADALVVNIGTLDNDSLDAMCRAGKIMSERHKNIVFDPVGAGFTSYRLKASSRIIAECRPTVIKGNASEILALSGRCVAGRGVDSSVQADMAMDAAQELSQCCGAVVVVSGETDLIVRGSQVSTVSLGSPLMAKVTAMGCVASAVVAAFTVHDSDVFLAAECGMTAVGLAGQRAAGLTRAPGSFQSLFIDKVYEL